MEIKDSDYKYFMAAFDHFIGQKWGGSQKRLHLDTGLSESMISLVRNKKKRAGLKSQFKIATAMGYTYEVFVEIGRSIIDTGMAPDVRPSYFSKRASDPDCLHRLEPQRYNFSSGGPRSEKIFETLKKIIESGDTRIITLVETGLESALSILTSRITGEGCIAHQESQSRESKCLLCEVGKK